MNLRILFLLFVCCILDGVCQQRKSIADTAFKAGDIIAVSPKDFSICKYVLRPEDKDSLEPLAKFIISHPEIIFEVGYHTDLHGNYGGNIKWSAKHAAWLREQMIEAFKIPPAQLVSKGYGESQPLVREAEIKAKKTLEEKEALQYKNRRFEFKVLSVK